MHNDRGQVSFFEGFAMLAIFLLVVAFAIQNVWHGVKASEERTLTGAASEYAGLKKMYTERLQTVPPGIVRTDASGAVIPHDAPIN